MTPPKPPRALINRHMQAARASGPKGFVRETYRMDRTAARAKAREWFDQYPKAAYWTQVESWRVLDNDVIEFTMRRLPSAD